MKQTTWFALVLAGGMLLSSCGKSDETANNENTEAATEQSNSATSNNVSPATVSTANAPREKATSAQTLKTFLPTIAGFKAEGEPNTTQLTMSGQEYAIATQRYTNGDKMFEITIADYNNVQGLTAAYAMMMGMSMETNNEVTKGEQFNGFPGWVTYKKDNSSAQAGVSVNDHMWVIVQADHGITIDQVRSVMNSIELKKLGSVQ